MRLTVPKRDQNERETATFLDLSLWHVQMINSHLPGQHQICSRAFFHSPLLRSLLHIFYQFKFEIYNNEHNFHHAPYKDERGKERQRARAKWLLSVVFYNNNHTIAGCYAFVKRLVLCKLHEKLYSA